MNLIEAYQYYKRGLVTKEMSDINLQKFFKTDPTDEQIFLLNLISKENNKNRSFFFLFYVISAFVIGAILTSAVLEAILVG